MEAPNLQALQMFADAIGERGAKLNILPLEAELDVLQDRAAR